MKPDTPILVRLKPDTTGSHSERSDAVLQTLQAERFQFRAHRETRKLPAYVLTVARGGPRLTP